MARTAPTGFAVVGRNSTDDAAALQNPRRAADPPADPAADPVGVPSELSRSGGSMTSAIVRTT